MAKSRADAPASNPTKKILLALGGVLLLIVVFAVIKSMGAEEDGVEVETAEAQVRAITQTVTASGQVRPEIEVIISSDVSGEIIALEVEEGDYVERGQLLLRVQPDFYVSQRDQAQAGVLSAQADAARSEADIERARVEQRRAQAELARVRQLVERGAVGRADLEAAQAAAENADAAVTIAQANAQAATYRIRSAQASARQASQQLGKTSIYAPMSGTVSQLNVELGERVVGTAQMNGTEILRIAELDRMQLEVDVNENDVVNIELADSARIEIDAFPDEPLRGSVTQIANSARVSGFGTQEQVTNFPVEVKILTVNDVDQGTPQPAVINDAERPAPPRGPVLRPGMSGTVDVYTRTVPNAVTVPIQAVTIRDFNEIRRREAREQARENGEDADEVATPAAPEEEDLRRVVFVIEEGKAVMREVETGIQDETHIEVVQGLAGGETVITGPFRLLRTELDDEDLVRPRTGNAGPAREED